MDKQFLTPEELKQIKDLNTSRNELVNQFGILEFDSQSLELQKEKLIDNAKENDRTSVLLLIYRKGSRQFVALTLKN